MTIVLPLRYNIPGVWAELQVRASPLPITERPMAPLSFAEATPVIME